MPGLKLIAIPKNEEVDNPAVREAAGMAGQIPATSIMVALTMVILRVMAMATAAVAVAVAVAAHTSSGGWQQQRTKIGSPPCVCSLHAFACVLVCLCVLVCFPGRWHPQKNSAVDLIRGRTHKTTLQNAMNDRRGSGFRRF